MKDIIHLQICKQDCDNKPTHIAKIGSERYIYCCDKGMKESLDGFNKWVGQNKELFVYKGSNNN